MAHFSYLDGAADIFLYTVFIISDEPILFPILGGMLAVQVYIYTYTLLLS